jgi:hypothetical protein
MEGVRASHGLGAVQPVTKSIACRPPSGGRVGMGRKHAGMCLLGRKEDDSWKLKQIRRYSDVGAVSEEARERGVM